MNSAGRHRIRNKLNIVIFRDKVCDIETPQADPIKVRSVDRDVDTFDFSTPVLATIAH